MIEQIRVCFLGTPKFAEEHLLALLKNPKYKVIGVVTQPDRPAGRKMQLTPSAVKQVAEKNNLPVLTPENLKKEPQILEQIKSWGADLAVVVAFGQILNQEFLDSFKFGAVNVHGSLLPKWRGAAPIQRSIEAGDKVSGVALQKMVKKLDAGALIAAREISLDDKITSIELYDKMSFLGCEMLSNELIQYVEGKVTLKEQNENEVTYAHKIEKEESLIDWNHTAVSIHNKVRAFTMGPGTYVLFKGKRLKIHKTSVVPSNEKNPTSQIAFVNADELHIQTADDLLSLLVVQPESKPVMSIGDFLKSVDLKKGDLFV